MDNNKLVIKPKKKKGEDGCSISSVRLETRMLTQLDEIAAETGRSRNELIRIFLDYALKHYVIENNEITGEKSE